MVLTIFSFHFSLNSELKTKDFGVLIPERGGMGFQNTDAMDSEIGAGTSKKIRPTFGNLFPSKMSFFRVYINSKIDGINLIAANPNALKLSCELRAATVAEAEGGGKVEAIHLERILPQLLLDF
ncbi:hypothetical protein GQ457_01G016930 [Hibiscus cannabinus]